MKVYLSPSQQEANIGVGAYGSESMRCQDIADRVRKLLVAAGVTVDQTPREWEPLGGTEWLAKVCARSNAFGADAHVCIHTNASSTSTTRGTDAWHYPGSVKGEALTRAIYPRVVMVSGNGRGIHTSPVFYETEHAAAPVAYMELIYHTNRDDVALVIEHPDDFAQAIAEGIAAWAGIELAAPEPVEELVTKGERPVLKQAMLRYALLNDVSLRDCERLTLVNSDGTMNYLWGDQAKRLAWRVSGRLDVEQSTQPTVELLKALR